MRRWFIAIFALHFFWSVGASTFEPLLKPAATHAVVAALTTQATEAAAPSGDADAAPAGQAPHGLTDEQPDMPEGLHPPLPVVRLGQATAPPARYTLTRLAPPTLDGPHRPPRAVLA